MTADITDSAARRPGGDDWPSRRYAPWLWLLAGLFLVRVLAQPLALAVQSSMLPEFQSWHSGVVPYPVLLLSQLVILACLVRTAQAFSTGRVKPRPARGEVALAFGGLYLAVMLARLVLGATLFRSQRWFASPLPTVFHIVLASYVLLYADFNRRYGLARQGLKTS